MYRESPKVTNHHSLPRSLHRWWTMAELKVAEEAPIPICLKIGGTLLQGIVIIFPILRTAQFDGIPVYPIFTFAQ